MSIVPQAVTPPQEWKQLYVAALLEKDSSRVPLLIADAERAIVLRARQLFGTPENNLREGEALDDALHTLRTLRGCLATREQSVRAARAGSAQLLN
ncbi:MAG TPA: hypothetical protein VF133_02535 [Terriglobales bacterium]